MRTSPTTQPPLGTARYIAGVKSHPLIMSNFGEGDKKKSMRMMESARQLSTLQVPCLRGLERDKTARERHPQSMGRRTARQMDGRTDGWKD